MSLSWNEIESRAAAFILEWKDKAQTAREKADAMPAELSAAHGKLDRLVEKAYGRAFAGDTDRVAFLFEQYRELAG